MSKQNTLAVTLCLWLLILTSQLFLVSTTKISKRNLYQRIAEDKASHSIRKRNVAEAIVQDSVSRGHVNHRRRNLLHEMLKAVDSSMGGGCGCLWAPGDNSGCVCDTSSLISTLFTILSSPENQRTSNELLKKALAKMHPRDRRVLHSVLRQRLIRIRRVTNRKMMHQRLWAKKRRNRLRQNPRSIFDGKQFFLF